MEINTVRTPKEIKEAQRIEKLEKRLEELQFLRGLEDEFEVTGYVYKIHGKNIRVNCRPTDAILDDHDFALNYGPGKFEVCYVWKAEDDTTHRKTVTYYTHASYKQLHKEYCQENGIEYFEDGFQAGPVPQAAAGPRFDFSRLMTPEGLPAILAAFETIKRLFAGNQNELMRDMMNQQNKMIETLAGKKENALESRIMGAAVERMLQPPKNDFEQMRGQIDMLKELGISTGLLQSDDKDQGPGMAILEKVLDHLPEFLARFQGDPVAAGRQLVVEQKKAKLIPLAPKQTQINAIKEVERRHGSTVAAGLAQGIGIKAKTINEAIKAAAPAAAQQMNKIKVPSNGVIKL